LQQQQRRERHLDDYSLSEVLQSERIEHSTAVSQINLRCSSSCSGSARYRSRLCTPSRNKNAICARALAQAQTASLDQTLIAGHDAASLAPAKTFTNDPSQAITGLQK